MSIVVKVEDVCKNFALGDEEVKVLKNLTFNINKGELRSWVIKNPITIPGKIEWLMASLIIAIFLKTKKVPGIAQATATKLAISCISIWALFMTRLLVI